MQYLNVWDYMEPEYPFTIFVGGRGTGKTYSALRGAYASHEGFILLRRTLEEMDLAAAFNPFAQLNKDYDWKVIPQKISKKVYGFYNGIEEEGILKPVGAPVGLIMGLSGIAASRGMGTETAAYNLMIYDEFIPEAHVHELQEEASALFNAYETINRNRELDGGEPMRLICLSNANGMGNPLFQELKIVRKMEKLLMKGSGCYKDPDRGLAVYLLKPSSEFERAKRQTAIARLTQGTKYAAMAYGNEFGYDDFSRIGSRKLVGAYPWLEVGPAKIWMYKGSGEAYATYARGSFAYSYKEGLDADRILARRRHGMAFKDMYASGAILFESLELKNLLLDFFGLKR